MPSRTDGGRLEACRLHLQIDQASKKSEFGTRLFVVVNSIFHPVSCLRGSERGAAIRAGELRAVAVSKDRDNNYASPHGE